MKLGIYLEDNIMNTMNGYIGQFNGIQLIENKLLVKREQKKTHKWHWFNWIYRRLYGYINVPDKEVYIMGDKIIGHPETLRALIDNINLGQ